MPTTPTLTVTDNADETATFTFTADVGTENLLYYQLISNTFPGNGWELLFDVGGGGGTTILAVDKGHYFFYLKSTLGSDSAISNVVQQNVTDGSDSVRKRCTDAIVATLQLLDLDGITGVFYRDRVGDATTSYPCIVVTWQDTPDMYLQGTNIRDEKGLPIQVTFQTSSGLGPASPVSEKISQWRDDAEACFSGQRLSGVNESIMCEIEPLSILPGTEEQYQKVISGFTVRAYIRKLRGFGN